MRRSVREATIGFSLLAALAGAIRLGEEAGEEALFIEMLGGQPAAFRVKRDGGDRGVT